MHVLAAVTLLQMAAERGGPALLDRRHHPPLGERDCCVVRGEALTRG